ncbi:MAG: MarR family transcriptional regulator [Beijerinckiaceae bacterium]|nr:MAG: MarR family transcriptional regulator [Beijerinckiaceae bacterium]
MGRMNDASHSLNSLETAVTDLLRATGLLLRRLRTESNPTELTWSESMILARLDEAGWMTTADLARREAVKPQSVGAALAVLEEQGLVQRKPHPTDGRQVLFGLTKDGIATRQRRTLLKRQWISAAMAKLDPSERETLIAAAALFKRLAES